MSLVLEMNTSRKNERGYPTASDWPGFNGAWTISSGLFVKPEVDACCGCYHAIKDAYALHNQHAQKMAQAVAYT